MKAPPPPRLEKRRAADFTAELRERARAWIPTWGLADGEGDFGRALLDIAARFSSEVAERLDRAGEKMQRGFLDWLAVPTEAARPARMPVVFKLADTAPGVRAPHPVRMQADANGTSVVFETETDVRLTPGTLQVVVGVDADADAYYLPAPGLSGLEALDPLPTQWQLKSFASADATTLQVDPETGLSKDLILEADGQQYLVVLKPDNGILTIEPGLTTELAQGTMLRKVTMFAPFDGSARDRQEHVLYLGHTELLDLEAVATLEIVGATTLNAGVKWEYWGKVGETEEVGWQPLETAPQAEQLPDALVLKKSKGAVELKEIGTGNNSRWIRAYRKNVTGEPFRADELTIRVNAGACRTTPQCPPTTETASPAAEAMANTTPLVLDNVFFPLGKEPRQFDAFYLGSQEAFSKAGAKVQLCFEMADTTFTALSAVREGGFTVLAGVAKDRALHLLAINPSTGEIGRFRDRDLLQPPLPGYQGQVTPGANVALDQQPAWRLPVWTEPDPNPLSLPVTDFLVAVTAGDAVWAWKESATAPTSSGWVSFASIPATSQAAPISGLVYLADPAAPQLVALRNYRMAVRSLQPSGAGWSPVPTKEAGLTIELESIVPVLSPQGGRLVTSVTEGLVGVSKDTKLYSVETTGACTQLTPTDVSTTVRPVAVRDAGGGLVVALVATSPLRLVSSHSTFGDASLPLDAGTEVLGFDAVLAGGALHFVASVRRGGEGYLISWPSPTAAGPIQLFGAAIPSGTGRPGGDPTEIAQHIVIPGTRADILVAGLDLVQRQVLQSDVKAGIVVPTSTPPFQKNDVVTLYSTPPFPMSSIFDTSTAKGNEVFYPIDPPFAAAASGAVHAFHSTVPALAFTGDLDATTETLKLDGGDNTTVVGGLVLADGAVYRVTNITPPVGPNRIADLEPAPPTKNGAQYWSAVPISARLAPYMQLDSANNNWDAALLDRARLVFAGASPEAQTGKAFTVTSGNRPELVVLDTYWTVKPAPDVGAQFVLDASVGSWSQQLGDTSTNPELSWEYSNGKGWSVLDIGSDATLNLKSTGAVRFTVPDDLAPSDWAGKTNSWIRARLVGGDYGREKITVKTTTTSSTTTEQTVDRSTEGIQAPSVVRLTISYWTCEGVEPKFVLAQDSGTLRDQSDANRTAGAIVEAFVPLAVTLGRLSGVPASPPTSADRPPDCGCAGGSVPAAPAASASGAPRATGRALFIGLDAAPSGTPVTVLLLVEKERPHDGFAPMAVEALVADRLVPIVTDDETRALGESGLLSMSFPLDPTPRELFGQTLPLAWLRLAPAPGKPAGDWKPALRGAYLNAAWAGSTETLTRELVGSSEGAPDLTLYLARPPVLRDTLELRVREPLGEEERIRLRERNPKRVLNEFLDLPGDWVLWDQVVDPADEPADARVYALDESNGEIRFGDNRHGMIPPIGQDSIVAFSYQRTEPAPPGTDQAPANRIPTRATLNLVSPVEGVEAVFAADQAAGGTPPESPERVVRFGSARQRHRGRAVTARDIEDLTLQSSPDIAQARAFVGPDSVRLVVVMKGKLPVPSAAQARELERLLLASAPPSLSRPGALRIRGPKVRRLRIEPVLRVERLDDAGALTEEVNTRLAGLLDTATGGPDGDGWPLGANPTEDDIAFALLDAPKLAGIGGVTLLESTGQGRERAWPTSLGPAELAMLADDPVRLRFETVKVIR